MCNKIIPGILILSVLVLIASLLLPDLVSNKDSMRNEQNRQYLPWHVEPLPGGSIRVFGIALGQSTLQEVNNLYQGGAEVSQFVSADGKYRIEAYFDKVVLGGFSSKMILVIDLPQEQQASMFQRGSRVSSMGGGRKKVTLSQQDLQTVYSSPVASLTYLTRAKLDDELIIKRFGQPGKRIPEKGNSTVHWLYPDLGLDLALSEDGHAVLQYVQPDAFSELMSPLLVPGTD